MRRLVSLGSVVVVTLIGLAAVGGPPATGAQEGTPVIELVTEGNLFLEKVLEANPLVRLSVTKEPPASRAAGAITVLHRVVPARLPAGPVLVVAAAELGGSPGQQRPRLRRRQRRRRRVAA